MGVRELLRELLREFREGEGPEEVEEEEDEEEEERVSEWELVRETVTYSPMGTSMLSLNRGSNWIYIIYQREKYIYICIYIYS